MLKAISRATFDLPRILDTLVGSAASLCDAFDAAILQKDGNFLRIVSHRGHIPSLGPVGQGTLPLTRGTSVGRAVLDRQMLHLADAQSETDEYPEESAIARRLGFRTLLAIPLLGAGEAVGAIALRRSEVRPFTDRQIELLHTFADQAVIAIENARLFAEVQASTRELTESLEYQTATSDVLNIISRSPNQLQPVLDAIVQTAHTLCQSDRAQFFRLEMANIVWQRIKEQQTPNFRTTLLRTPSRRSRARGPRPARPHASVARSTCQTARATQNSPQATSTEPGGDDRSLLFPSCAMVSQSASSRSLVMS